MQVIEVLRTNMEWVAALIGTVIALGGIGVTVLVWLWKLSQWIKGIEESKEERDAREEETVSAIQALEKAVLKLEVKLDEREKTSLKLEGAVDVTRSDLSKTNALLNRVLASLEKLWATIEKPRRISDTKT